MTICERLSDRMPAVARGDVLWSAEEQAHLAACAECRAEWELVSAASGLGHDVAAALDPHHVTERVLGRLRVQRAHARDRRTGWLIAGLAAAAAAVLAVWTGRPRGPAVPVPVAAVQIPLPELDSLRTPELEAVLHALDAPLGTTMEGVDTADLDDLDARELQRVLDGLEG